MSQDTTTAGATEYLLLFRDSQWDKGMSPDEVQAALNEFIGWLDNLTETGILKTARPLQDEGRTVQGKTLSVSDGPFAESKETIGGFFLLDVATMEEAVEIAKRNPLLKFGGALEVRPVAKQCPHMQRLGMKYDCTATPA